jgi:hypothetical protein
MRNSLLLLSLFSLPLLGSLRAPECLGSLALVNMPNGFVVLKENKIHTIEPDCVDAMLRKINYKQRALYILKGGGLVLDQTDTGEYTLQSIGNIKGGGPVSGAIAYWVTKSLCWGGVAAAASVATAGVVAAGIATGGAAIGASAGAVATATGVATTGTSLAIGAIGGGAAGAAGASLVAGGITATAGATAAATTAVTAGATAGGTVGLVAGIETASIGASAFFTLIPFLP